MTDSIVRVAAVAIGAIGLTCVLLIGALAWRGGRDLPEGLFALATGCVGALATMLTSFAPTPVRGGRRSTDPPLPPDEEKRAA